jgi:hypothetical protein
MGLLTSAGRRSRKRGASADLGVPRQRARCQPAAAPVEPVPMTTTRQLGDWELDHRGPPGFAACRGAGPLYHSPPELVKSGASSPPHASRDAVDLGPRSARDPSRLAGPETAPATTPARPAGARGLSGTAGRHGAASTARAHARRGRREVREGLAVEAPLRLMPHEDAMSAGRPRRFVLRAEHSLDEGSVDSSARSGSPRLFARHRSLARPAGRAGPRARGPRPSSTAPGAPTVEEDRLADRPTPAPAEPRAPPPDSPSGMQKVEGELRRDAEERVHPGHDRRWSVVGMEPIPSARAASMRFWHAGRMELAQPGGSAEGEGHARARPHVVGEPRAAR